MKKAGDFWIPDAEQDQVDAIAKGGAQISHLEAALAYCTRFRVAIDGGANVGTWTVPLRARFEHVYAFEPAADTFACLDLNSPSAHNRQEALGDLPGYGRMNTDETWPNGTGSRYVTKGDDFPITFIDSMNMLDLDFLKLDLEGMEPMAIKGAMSTLVRCKPVVLIEDKPRFATRYGYPAGEATRLLKALGYSLEKRIGADLIFVP